MQPPDEVVCRLKTAMFTGGSIAFDSVPDLLRKIIQRRIWAGQVDRNKTRFKSFEAFATAKKPEGLESLIDDLLAFCRKKPDVQALINGASERLATASEAGAMGGRGKKKASDNITSFERGTNATYTLKRLKRDRPDLAERVAAGEISAHAAAIEAGFRKRTITVPDDLEGAIAAIEKRFGVDKVRRALFAIPKGKEVA